MSRRYRLTIVFAAWLILPIVGSADPGRAGDVKINTLPQLFARLGSCWKSPALPWGDPGMQITVMVSFKRNGEILGHPKVTYESEYASENSRLIYRTALAEALQRCTPMPFTEELGNAVAGRPLRIRFDARQMKSTEKRSWQTTKIL
jgi:hypothetical protein